MVAWWIPHPVAIGGPKHCKECDVRWSGTDSVCWCCGKDTRATARAA